MKNFEVTCDKPSVICRFFHRPWWLGRGNRKHCMACGSCWDARERPGEDRKAVPERRIKTNDSETLLVGVPAILEGTDQFRIQYGGQVIRVTVLEILGPMLKCRWIKDGGQTMVCVHRNLVIEQDRDRLERMGGEKTELQWASDGSTLE